jgi:hypothetical protein
LATHVRTLTTISPEKEVKVRRDVFGGVIKKLGGLGEAFREHPGDLVQLRHGRGVIGLEKIARTIAGTASWGCLGTAESRFRMKARGRPPLSTAGR